MTATVQRLDAIDAIRGVAVLLVVLVHTAEPVPSLPAALGWVAYSGQFGVQLFFLASAFTLCHSMTLRNEASSTQFFLRRFFRIAPLYYAGIVLYLGWRWILLQINGAPHFLEYSASGLLLNGLFLHGLFPAHYNFVVPGGWSISVEMLFYFCFPALFAFVSKLTNVRFVWLVVGWIVLSVTLQYAVYVSHAVSGGDGANDTFGFYYTSIFNQLPVFLIGMLVYRYRALRPGLAHLLMGAVFIVAAAAMLNNRSFDTGIDAAIYHIIVSAGFAIFVLWALQLGELSTTGLSYLKAAGQRSFSIYLLHFFVIEAVVLAYNWVGISFAAVIDFGIIISVVVVTTYILAGLTWRYVERPAIQFGNLVIANQRDLGRSKTA